MFVSVAVKEWMGIDRSAASFYVFGRSAFLFLDMLFAGVSVPTVKNSNL